jgi:hypothetical protein
MTGRKPAGGTSGLKRGLEPRSFSGGNGMEQAVFVLKRKGKRRTKSRRNKAGSVPYNAHVSLKAPETAL